MYVCVSKLRSKGDVTTSGISCSPSCIHHITLDWCYSSPDRTAIHTKKIVLFWDGILLIVGDEGMTLLPKKIDLVQNILIHQKVGILYKKESLLIL